MHLKAVSFGQDLSDAIDISLHVTGYSVQGPLPTTPVGHFDTANNNCLIDWTGTPPFITGQIEGYDFEIMNGPGSGASTTRAYYIVPELNLSLAHAPPYKIASGDTLPHGQIGFVDPGGVEFNFNPHDFDTHNYLGWAQSQATSPPSGLFVEWEVGPVISPVAFVPKFLRVDTDDNTSSFYWYRPTVGSDYTQVMEPEANGSIFHIIVPGDRFSIFFREDGLVDYYINYLGPGSVPAFTSPNAWNASKQYRLNIKEQNASGGSGAALSYVYKTRWVRAVPEFMYLDSAQRADNGSLSPAIIYVRVRQRSFYGAGPASAWVYAALVR